MRVFLLTRHWVETDAGTTLVFWFASDTGSVEIRVPAQESVFFLSTSAYDEARRLLDRVDGCRAARIQLKNFAGEAVIALYFQSQRQLVQTRAQLTERSVEVLEADLRPPDRFLMERFITGPCEIDVISGVEHAVSAPTTVTARGCGILRLEDVGLRATDYTPALRVVSLDIETAYGEDELYSIALSGVSGEVVFMGGSGTDDSTTFYCGSETVVIRKSLAWIDAHDPDVLIGWNVVGFDLRFLERRCQALRIDFGLGRGGEAVRWRQLRDADRYFAYVPGRVVLDGIELLRTASYTFESFSLEHVSRELLGRGKLVHDVDARAVEIQTMYETNKTALAAYNLEDCRLVTAIFEKTELLAFAIERATLTGLEMDRLGGSVAAFDFLYLPKLHRQGYVAPVVRAEDIAPSPGGYVLDSTPGLYRDVVVLDFKSLYPSIIRTFNIDPLALALAETAEDPIPGFDGGAFARESRLLPSIIEQLWSARDVAKREARGASSQAIKIIMNSFYGVLGTPGCRFFDTRLVSSITRRGHEILTTTRDLIEDAGHKVIYGDTDSVFVLLDDTASVSVRAQGLVDELNAFWRNDLATRYHIESALELQFETHFERFLMPTVRGSATGSKKRYAGMTPDGDLVFKGLETVRSDWSNLARVFQRELYARVFRDEPVKDYVKASVNAVLSGPDRRDLVLRKRLRRQLGEYVKNVPPHVNAARKAEKIRQERGLPAQYEGRGWVEYLMTVNGPEPVLYSDSAIDHDFYINRQLAPIADSILQFSGTSLRQITDKQMDLF